MKDARGITYSLTAGVFGGHMEVDHILTHNDVWNPITIISNLAWQRSYSISGYVSHTTQCTSTPLCVCVCVCLQISTPGFNSHVTAI